MWERGGGEYGGWEEGRSDGDRLGWVGGLLLIDSHTRVVLQTDLHTRPQGAVRSVCLAVRGFLELPQTFSVFLLVSCPIVDVNLLLSFFYYFSF